MSREALRIAAHQIDEVEHGRRSRGSARQNSVMPGQQIGVQRQALFGGGVLAEQARVELLGQLGG